MRGSFYNDNEKYAAAWLRNLGNAGHIPKGVVDSNDIRELDAGELRSFTQCHFFAGVGVWSYALRLAGWPENYPIWTGSCPCQPFSGAGQRRGFADERHLWPSWLELIKQCRPGVIIGEQVASPDGLAWWDIVSADLENEGYATAAVDLCAASVGAPHMRQRLFWVAYSTSSRSRAGFCDSQSTKIRGNESTNGRATSGLGDATGNRYGSDDMETIAKRREFPVGPTSGACVGGLGDTNGRDACAERKQRGRKHRQQSENPSVGYVSPATGPLNGYWRDADWLHCRDGRWRPVEPGAFPLAHGAAARVGRLRAYGNAIVAPLAAEFIETVMEVLRQHGS